MCFVFCSQALNKLTQRNQIILFTELRLGFEFYFIILMSDSPLLILKYVHKYKEDSTFCLFLFYTFS